MKKHFLLTATLALALSPLGAYAYGGVSEWAKDEIALAFDNGIITESFNDKNFSDAATREQFAEICVALYESETGKRAIMPEINPFIDADNTKVTKAYELGVIKGVTAVEFEPSACVTREEAAVMLNRTAAISGVNDSGELSTSGFADDFEISDWAKEAVLKMSNMNVIKGKENGKFAPHDNVTIEESFVIAQRLYNITKDNGDEKQEVKLTDYMPVISFGKDYTEQEEDGSVTVTVSGVTLDNYNEYISEVQRFGYTDVENIFPDTFIIANNGTIRINVSFGGGVLKVVLTKIN